MQYKDKLESNYFFTYSNKNPLNQLNFGNIYKNKTNDLTKELNILNFIKLKDKFYLQDFFDEKGTNNFLVSKKNALMEIILDDEVSEENPLCSDNKINHSVGKKIKENNKNHKNKNCKRKHKLKTITPIKSNKNKESIQKNETITTSHVKNDRKIATIKTQQTSNKKNQTNNINNSFDSSSKRSNDTNDSNYIYKYIIDNPNESDDKLYKKLKKEIKKTEHKKLNKRKSLYMNNNNVPGINNNDYCYTPKVKNNKNLNPFNFSQKATNLMMTETIELSSIDDKDINSNKREKIKNNKIEKYILNDEDILSNEESLLHIISDLM